MPYYDYEEEYDDNWVNLLEDDSPYLDTPSADDSLVTRGSLGEGNLIDYDRFSLSGPAQLYFNVESQCSATITIYKLTTDRYGNPSLKSLFSKGLSKNPGYWYYDYDYDWERDREIRVRVYEEPEIPYSLMTKGLLLDSGDYFISVKTSNRYIESSDYEVYYGGTFFGDKGDNGNNNWKPIARGPRNEDDSEYYEKYAEYNLGVVDNIDDFHLDESQCWVGFGDDIDYWMFSLEKSAKLSFCVTADDATKFSFYKLTKDRNGKLSLKSLVSQNLTKNKGYWYYDYDYDYDTDREIRIKMYEEPEIPYSLSTKGVLLETGTYFISVQSTNAAKGGYSDYSVDFNHEESMFFDNPMSDNWDDDWKPIAMCLGNVAYQDMFGSYIKSIDDTGFSMENWVGFGDSIDYGMFTMEMSAKLAFTITADDAAKFTLYKLNTDRNGKPVLKSIQSVALKKNNGSWYYDYDYDWERDREIRVKIYEAPEVPYSITTNAFLLEKGATYFYSVQSTNAAKGGSATYNVSLDGENSMFFNGLGDNGDDWTDMEKNGDDSTEFCNYGTIDNNSNMIVNDGWVGLDDEKDFVKFSLDTTAKLSFTINSSDAMKFIIYKLNPPKNGAYSLKALQTTTLAKTRAYWYYDYYWEERVYVEPESNYAATTKLLKLTEGDYFLCIQSTNAAKGGSASYSVSLNENSEFDYGYDLWAALEPPALNNNAVADALQSDEALLEWDGIFLA